MIVIVTRQKGDRSGWLCEATVNGTEQSFEATAVVTVQVMMQQWLHKKGINIEDVKWLEPVFSKPKK